MSLNKAFHQPADDYTMLRVDSSSHQCSLKAGKGPIACLQTCDNFYYVTLIDNLFPYQHLTHLHIPMCGWEYEWNTLKSLRTVHHPPSADQNWLPHDLKHFC